MKKIFYYIALVLGTIAITSGCSGSSKQEKVQLAEEIKQVEKDNEILMNEISNLKDENGELSQEIVILQEQIEKLNEESSSDVDQGETLLTIYGGNIDSYEKEEVGQVRVSNDLPLEEKLQLMADGLSRDVFEGLGIELVDIEIIHGKEVAIINLTETENGSEVRWDTRYFQGSAGGAITSVSLSNTFLQKEYDGEWIDGVKFLYNNEEINFQHVEGLSEANYR